MRPLTTLVFLAALSPSLAWAAPAVAEPVRPAEGMNLAQAERMAADLKQGMSIDEVQKLLGKPRRTMLKNTSGNASSAPWQGILLWTYNWTGPSSPGILRVEFAAKAKEAWYVNSWEWATY